jgi:protein-tyrosine-phosphatase
MSIKRQKRKPAGDPAIRKVVLVCTANICRSPMAEGIWNALRQTPRFSHLPPSESAGVDALHDSKPTQEAVSMAKAHGIDISSHISRQLDKPILDGADLVLCMTRAQQDIILGAYPQAKRKVALLTEFKARSKPADPDIADPYRGTLDQYLSCYARLEAEISRVGLSWHID